ncbi:MAG: Type secretion system protein [Pseudomonadota bacterium]|jgi:type II secretory pathway component PulM
MKLLAILSYLWNSRAPRERLFIIIALLVIVLGSLYSGFIDPALTDLKRFKTSIPLAQATLAKVKILSAQVNAQPKNEAVLSGDMSNLEAIQASLSAANIEAKVSDTPPWLITIHRANGEDLLNWLRQYPIKLIELKRIGHHTDAYWQGEVTLNLQSN